MKFTIVSALTLLTYAVGSVTASVNKAHIERSVNGDHAFEGLAARHEAGLPNPRVSKRIVEKRFDPNTQSLAKIGIFDSTTGESNGFLYVFNDMMRNTTTRPSLFQYTKPANPGDAFDIEFPVQGGVSTKQFLVATKNSATYGLNSPTASADAKCDLYGGAYPLRSPAGSPPVHDAIHRTWFESAVWTAAEDGTLTCTWVNPDGSTVELHPFLVIEALHFSPNPANLYPLGGPWFDIKTVTLKLVDA